MPREGGFAKDEGLAFTFAEKAARKGLVSAEFAMVCIVYSFVPHIHPYHLHRATIAKSASELPKTFVKLWAGTKWLPHTDPTMPVNVSKLSVRSLLQVPLV